MWKKSFWEASFDSLIILGITLLYFDIITSSVKLSSGS